MSGPQIAPEPKTIWNRLVAPAAIFVGIALVILALADVVRDWAFTPLRPALDWTRQQNNAAAVQAVAAITQAVGATFLLAVTMYSTRMTRELADRERTQTQRAQHQASVAEQRALRAAEHQAQIATMPVIIFREPMVQSGLIREVILKIINVGHGPALFTRIELLDADLNFELNRAEEAITLKVGEEADLVLLADERDELRWILRDSQPDEHGRFPLVTLHAECKDVRGEDWESEARLAWSRDRESVVISNAYYSFPPRPIQ
ncbi:MAG: hypothetical protein U0031_09490 [Thermomicrobiales bacterium]